MPIQGAKSGCLAPTHSQSFILELRLSFLLAKHCAAIAAPTKLSSRLLGKSTLVATFFRLRRPRQLRVSLQSFPAFLDRQNMGDVLVESRANSTAPHKKGLASMIPNIESFEGLPPEGGDEYETLKKLQRELEYVPVFSCRDVVRPVLESRGGD